MHRGFGVNWALFDLPSWACVVVGGITMSGCAWWTMTLTDTRAMNESYRAYALAITGKNISQKASSQRNTLPICVSEGQKQQ